MEDFDWVVGPPPPKFAREISTSQLAKMYAPRETETEKQSRHLRQLSLACRSCGICELGNRDAVNGTTVTDPHLFSNCNVSKWVILADSPSWADLFNDFATSSLKRFWGRLKSYGISNDDFYITSLVKCYSASGDLKDYIEPCQPYLSLELQVLNPTLIITIGESSFASLYDGPNITGDRLKLYDCKKYECKILPIDAESESEIEFLGRLLSKMKSKRT